MIYSTAFDRKTDITQLFKDILFIFCFLRKKSQSLRRNLVNFGMPACLQHPSHSPVLLCPGKNYYSPFLGRVGRASGVCRNRCFAQRTTRILCYARLTFDID